MATALTDRKIRALKPRSKPYDEPDGEVPGLNVRVMKSGHRSFVLTARYPRFRHPTRRALGDYVEQSKIAGNHEPTVEELLALDALTLAEARRKAQVWRGMIGRGVDPAGEGERRKRAELRRQENTLEAVVQDFTKDKLATERKGHDVQLDIAREFLPRWGKWPITDITPADARALIKAVKDRDAPAQARNILVLGKRMFTWAIDQQCYGLELNPFDKLKAGKIIGEKRVGDRVLDDDEIFALERAAARTPGPVGRVYQILLRTALRLNEVADATWSELDLQKREWTIPAARMKGKNGKARAHTVPLTDDLLRILSRLPRQKGPYLFSVTSGASPVWMSDKVKKRIDARMLCTLRALARRRGDDPSKVELAAWTNHDIRRTCRSQFSRLKVTEEAREALLAHVRPGIKATYDHHDYFSEKLEALTLWGNRLREITEPAPPNVVALPITAAR